MTKEEELEILNKVSNSPLIKKVYPIVDHVRVDVEKNEKGEDYLVFNIYVGESKSNEWTLFNMYENGIDPHYLVDYHIFKLYKDFLPKFKHIPFSNEKSNVIVHAPDGKVIYDFFKGLVR